MGDLCLFNLSMTSNPFSEPDIKAALNGRYALGPVLRVGGQGVVYRATRLKDANGSPCSDDVALKLHLDSRQDERVKREINAVKGLRHASLATLLEDGEIGVGGRQTRYIAWGFIEGEALDSRLSRGALKEDETVKIGLDVTAAITALWSLRIVHRDIAPKNVMVKPNGNAVLVDLGGARHLEETTITAPGATFGTVGYFSPEQCRAEHALTSASDIYALGVLLLECLLGHHPTNFDQSLLMRAQPSVKKLLPSVDTQLCQLIEVMLHLRAPFRPQLGQLANSLKKILEDE